jgi:chaperonin cofactor prefoldin
MSTEAMPREAAHLAAIFQKAYAKAVSLQRMDEQVAGLLEQRQKLELEFREVQDELNVECERMLKSTSVTASNLLAQMAESNGEDHTNGHARLARLKAAQAGR